jgi:hypothetical protein
MHLVNQMIALPFALLRKEFVQKPPNRMVILKVTVRVQQELQRLAREQGCTPEAVALQVLREFAAWQLQERRRMAASKENRNPVGFTA